MQRECDVVSRRDVAVISVLLLLMDIPTRNMNDYFLPYLIFYTIENADILAFDNIFYFITKY